MAQVASPAGSCAPRSAGTGAGARLRRAAATLAHVCGLTLHMKRYIEKSRAKEWALFYLSIKNHSANELLFGMSNYSKYNVSKDCEKLKTLLFIQPKRRSQENLRKIQLYLKKNRAFHSLPNEVQLQLCQTAIYQEFEAGSMLLRQGHLKVMSSNISMNRKTNSEILSEFEEGDFIGESCLLTNARRPASISCKTDVKVLVISKEYCETCQRMTNGLICCTSAQWSNGQWADHYEGFLLYSCPESTRTISRNMQLPQEPPIILSMAKRKDRLSGSLFFTPILQGRCRIVAQINCEEISVHSRVMKTGFSTLKNVRSVLPPKGTPAITGRSLETFTVSPKTSFSTARKKRLDAKKPPLQGSSPATCLVEIRVLEQGEVFGLTEALDSACDLHLSLISEGVECIFIPKTLFLAEASPECRRTALALLCAYPTAEDISKYLAEQQAWNEYKARLLAQQLKTGS